MKREEEDEDDLVVCFFQLTLRIWFM